MSLKNDFEGNFNIFVNNDPEYDLEIFNQLVSEHGQDFANGFLKATLHIDKVLDHILYKKFAAGFYPGTPSTVRTETRELKKQIKLFLDNLNITQSNKSHPPNPSP